MFVRITDPRILQAQRHGLIVGLPREDAYNIAMKADLLCSCAEWRDVIFMFGDDLAANSDGRHKVRVDARWWIAFDWIEGLGAINIRLRE